MHRFGCTLMTLALVLVCILPLFADPITGSFVTGGATTGTGPWTMTSTNSIYSLLTLVPSQGLPFSQYDSLGVSYNSVLGGIGGGSPRIDVIFAGGDILIHWGPPGTFSDPSLGPGNTGNLLSLTDNGRYDLSGVGGSAYTDRAAALAAAAGLGNVLGFQIILDSFGGNDRNFIINGISATAPGQASIVPEPLSLAIWSLLGVASSAAGLVRHRWKNK